MQMFVQVFSFIFSILIYPIYAAPGLDKPPVLSADKPQLQPGKQFKKAVNLINIGSYEEAENILVSFLSNDLWQVKAYFLLGRLYKEQGFLDKSEYYLKKAAVQYFLLKDYALMTLTDIYITKEKFDKVIETTRQIQNKVLLRKTRLFEITALLALEKEEKAMRVLYQYIKEYQGEWDSKLILARLLKNSGKTEEAIRIFKDIYINATPLVADALKELKDMKADTFIPEELLRMAENLFKKRNFQRAEATYREVLKDIDDSAMKDKIRFAIGMCQVNQKQYNIAAKSFGLIKTPEAMYWKARVLYRADDRSGFIEIIKDFEKEYPGDKYLAELLLILADDLRRTGNLNESEEIFRKVLKDFPEKTEEVFWGLGWMNYTNGYYKEAAKYFSKFTSSVKNKKHHKYLYWEAKNREMLAKDCLKEKSNLSTKDSVCPEGDEDNDAYSRLSGDAGYYGFLVKIRFRGLEIPVKIEVAKPEVPKGRVYERIEVLKFLGMNKEAAEEIKMVLKFTKNLQEVKYLGYTAIDIDEYKSIIYFAEGIKNKEFLPLSYPLGYWDVVKKAAESEAVDAYLIAALIREESRFDPMAVSIAGAVGLMQLMPSTAHRIKKELKITIRDDSELYDVKKNILIGTHYLSLLMREFKEIPLALAAYNAGENALRKWIVNSKHKDIEEFIEDIPYKETKRYVKKVLKSYWQYRTIEGLPLRKANTVAY